VRRVRALAPRPGAYTEHAGERLRVLAASALDGTAGDAPGTVRRGGPTPLRIATGAGWLVPRTLQRPGGRPLPAAEFLRGCPLADGARLGG
jgi:methionyl-tRNA formyltransferase